MSIAAITWQEQELLLTFNLAIISCVKKCNVLFINKSQIQVLEGCAVIGEKKSIVFFYNSAV